MGEKTEKQYPQFGLSSEKLSALLLVALFFLAVSPIWVNHAAATADDDMSMELQSDLGLTYSAATLDQVPQQNKDDVEAALRLLEQGAAWAGTATASDQELELISSLSLSGVDTTPQQSVEDTIENVPGAVFYEAVGDDYPVTSEIETDLPTLVIDLFLAGGMEAAIKDANLNSIIWEYIDDRQGIDGGNSDQAWATILADYDQPVSSDYCLDNTFQNSSLCYLATNNIDLVQLQQEAEAAYASYEFYETYLNNPSTLTNYVQSELANSSIQPVTLQRIAITTPATKLTYHVDDTLDLSGLEVTGTYSDGSTQVETITASNVTGFNSSAAATGQVLTITFDGQSTTYTVDIAAAPSSDATLSSLTVAETPVSGFSPSVFLYNFVLPSGTVLVPIVSATTTDPNAVLAITQATSTTGSAIIIVTAQSGETQTYTINFTVAAIPPSGTTFPGVTQPYVDTTQSLTGGYYVVDTNQIMQGLGHLAGTATTFTYYIASASQDAMNWSFDSTVGPDFSDPTVITSGSPQLNGGTSLYYSGNVSVGFNTVNLGSYVPDPNLYYWFVLDPVTQPYYNNLNTFNIGGTDYDGTGYLEQFCDSGEDTCDNNSSGNYANPQIDNMWFLMPGVTSSYFGAPIATPVISSLSQSEPDGTIIPEGATIEPTPNTTVLINGLLNLSDTTVDAAGNLPYYGNLQLQVELQPTGQSFTGTSTNIGSAAVQGSSSIAELSGLNLGNYHWQAMAVDAEGGTSTRQTISNPPASTDFNVQDSPSALTTASIINVNTSTYDVVSGYADAPGSGNNKIQILQHLGTNIKGAFSSIQFQVICGGYDCPILMSLDQAATDTYGGTGWTAVAGQTDTWLYGSPDAQTVTFNFPAFTANPNDYYFLALNNGPNSYNSAIEYLGSPYEGSSDVEDFVMNGYDEVDNGYTTSIKDMALYIPGVSGGYVASGAQQTFPLLLGNTLLFATTTNPDGSLSATIPDAIVASTTSDGINIGLSIPTGTVITASSSWDGMLMLPEATTTFTPPTSDSGYTASTTSAIAVGAGDTPLTLNPAARLLFAGQTGQLIGWSRGGVFTPITTLCSADTQTAGDALPAGGDCRFDNGTDLIVWTKHFTSFITYTQTALPVMIVSSTIPIPDINVANGTALTTLNLPATVGVILSDGSTSTLSVAWNGGMPSYNSSASGTYTFVGTLNLTGGITNPNAVTAGVNVVVAPPVTYTVTIDKFIDGKMATATSANGAAFPMVSSWNTTNLGGTGSGSYALGPVGFNSANPYEAITSSMTASSSYTTNEVTNTPLVGTDCTVGDPFSLVGYSTGPTPAAAASASVSTTIPNFTNLASNEYVVTWNKNCLPAPVLLTPTNGAATTTAGLTSVSWSPITDPAGDITYIYQASNSSTTNPNGSFTSPVYTSVPLAATTIPTPGTPAGIYFWHVYATDADGNTSPWSPIWTFTVVNTGTLVVEKDAVGGDGTFAFTGNNGLGTFTITTASGTGSETFNNVTPGIYTVAETNIPKGWMQTDSSCSSVSVMAGGVEACVITNTENKLLGEISGTKYVDEDGDGTLRNGDHHRLAGVTVYLDINHNGKLDSGEPSTVTNKLGEYHFSNLPAGTYRVREVEQPGWIETYPASVSYAITLGAGKVSLGNNFGDFQFGTISGVDFNDLNGNGRKDKNEPGLSGWTIKLTKINSSFTESVATDANGNYLFTNLGPGIYQVREISQAGWVATTQNPPNVTIDSGTAAQNENFGNHFGAMTKYPWYEGYDWYNGYNIGFGKGK